MFKFLMAVMLTISPFWVRAQYTLSGTIHSKNGEMLEGATVELTNSNTAAISGKNGAFQFTNQPEGKYTLLVRYLGFKDFRQTAEVHENLMLDITLEENVFLADEVIVTATRAAVNSPVAWSTLSSQEIKKQNFGQDLPYLLNNMPSVVVTSDAGTGIGYTGIRIRGSDPTRVNVTINGVPYNDSESLGTYWVDIPDVASSSQSVQMQRGVGTSTNGASAFGATINLQTLARREDQYADVTTSFGSFNSRRLTTSFGTGLLSGHWTVDGRMSLIASDGFIDRANADLKSYFLSTGYYSKKTTIKALAFGGKERTYQSWFGVPESRLNNDTDAMLVTASNEGWNDEQTENLLTSDSRTFNPYTYENQVDDYGQDHIQLHVSQLLSASLTGSISLHYTHGKGFYEEYRYDDDLENYGLSPVIIGDSVITSVDLIRRRWLDNKFYGLTYSLNYVHNKAEIILGGGWNRYDGDHFGQIVWSEVSPSPHLYQYYFNNGDKRDGNVYARVNYELNERWNVYADLQWRGIRYKTAGIENDQNNFSIDTTFLFFNPKAGITYSPDENQKFYASIAVANHEPSRDDFIDNLGATPKSEVLRDVELGYRRNGTRFSGGINLYYMDYKDQLVLTGKVNDVGAPIKTNVPDSYRAGVELESAFKIVPQVNLSLNLALSRNKLTDFHEIIYDYGADFDEYNEVQRNYKDSDISFSPSVVSSSTLTYSPFNGMEIAWLSKYVGRQYLDNTSDKSRVIGAYFVNDLRILYALKAASFREVSLSLMVNNLFNEQYESNGYTWGYVGGGEEYRENYFFPQAGRNYMAMISLGL